MVHCRPLRVLPVLMLAMFFASAQLAWSQPPSPIFIQQPPQYTSATPSWEWIPGSWDTQTYALWPSWEPAPIYLSPMQTTFRGPGNLKPGFHWINLATIDNAGRWSPWVGTHFTFSQSPAVPERAVGFVVVATAGFPISCSGTLVGEDLFLTAGHCLPEGTRAADLEVHFEFVSGNEVFRDDLTYGVKAILQQSNHYGGDFAQLRLEARPRNGIDYPLPGLRFGFLPLRTTGTPAAGDQLTAVHHASRAPQQAYSGRVSDVYPGSVTVFLGAGVDLFPGASGAALVDAAGFVVAVADHQNGPQTRTAVFDLRRHIRGIGGMCLAAEGGTFFNGTRVVLENCVPGKTSQLWRFVGAQLRNEAGGCTTQLGAFFSNGTPIQLFDCLEGAAHQKYRTYEGTIKSEYSGRCLTTQGAFAHAGTPIIFWDCDPRAAHQKWSFVFPAEL